MGLKAHERIDFIEFIDQKRSKIVTSESGVRISLAALRLCR
jgi:hypothetical protein